MNTETIITNLREQYMDEPDFFDTLSQAADRLAELQKVCAEAYQFAAVYAPEHEILDNLAAAANGDPVPHESVLPIETPETRTQP
jgi:anion-transporting  ArsA/GET3 family ATPase